MSDKARRSRRRWSGAFTRRVVAEAMAPGASAAAIARCYDLSANLLFNWKRRYGVSDQFLPIETSGTDSPAPQANDGPTVPSVSDISSIEIALANGNRIAVKGCLDGDTMCRLVQSLAGP